MEWNLLAFAQLAFFGLGAWYFLKCVRKKTGEGLRCEDNIIEMDKLMLMKEQGLTEPLSEQTRPKETVQGAAGRIYVCIVYHAFMDCCF